MPAKKQFHPKALLSSRRNVTKGLAARTKILTVLETGPASAPEIAKKTGMRYSRVNYHLRSLQTEKIAQSTKKRRRNTWSITRYGQQSLEPVD